MVYRVVAAILFAAQAVFSIWHGLTGAHYPAFTHGINVFVDALTATIWVGATVALLLERTFGLYVLAWIGVATSVVHGAMVNLSWFGAGTPFWVAAVAIAVCLARISHHWAPLRSPTT